MFVSQTVFAFYLMFYWPAKACSVIAEDSFASSSIVARKLVCSSSRMLYVGPRVKQRRSRTKWLLVLTGSTVLFKPNGIVCRGRMFQRHTQIAHLLDGEENGHPAFVKDFYGRVRWRRCVEP